MRKWKKITIAVVAILLTSWMMIVGVVLYGSEAEDGGAISAIAEELYDGQSLYSCLTNLRQIEVAKAEIALEDSLNSGDEVPLNRIHTYWGGGLPKCPGGGTYKVNPIGIDPVCSLAGTSGPTPRKKLVFGARWLIGWRWAVPPSGPHQMGQNVKNPEASTAPNGGPARLYREIGSQ